MVLRNLLRTPYIYIYIYIYITFLSKSTPYILSYMMFYRMFGLLKYNIFDTLILLNIV